MTHCWMNVKYHIPINATLTYLDYDAGVDLCKNYNVDGQNLFFKWEALRIGQTAKGSEIRLFTKSTVATLRDQLQREAPKAHVQVKKQQQAARVRLDGPMSVNLGTLGRNFVKGEPKKEQRLGGAPLAGPSTVRVADQEDALGYESKCTLIQLIAVDTIDKTFIVQIDICTRRFQSAVKV